MTMHYAIAANTSRRAINLQLARQADHDFDAEHRVESEVKGSRRLGDAAMYMKYGVHRCDDCEAWLTPSEADWTDDVNCLACRTLKECESMIMG